jgi:hypothetical protein
MRFSLIAGPSRDWAALLRLIDARGLALSQREMNQVLNEIVRVRDAENEARAIKFKTAEPQPKMRSTPRGVRDD